MVGGNVNTEEIQRLTRLQASLFLNPGNQSIDRELRLPVGSSSVVRRVRSGFGGGWTEAPGFCRRWGDVTVRRGRTEDGEKKEKKAELKGESEKDAERTQNIWLGRTTTGAGLNRAGLAGLGWGRFARYLVALDTRHALREIEVQGMYTSYWRPRQRCLTSPHSHLGSAGHGHGSFAGGKHR